MFNLLGEQPILEAPAYIGITIFFFAIIAVFYSNNKFKYWLISGALISLLLSWEKAFYTYRCFYRLFSFLQ